MKTVKDLVNEINISKVSIYNMIKKPEFKGHIFKGEDNVTLLDETAEQLLKAHYFKARGETIKDIIAEEINNLDSKDGEEINSLDILTALQQQLDVKDSQIDNLFSVIFNQQKLQATHLLTANSNPDTETEDSKSKGLFRRIFGL